MLTLIGCLLAEFTWPGWTDRQGRVRGPDEFIVFKLPLARAFALFAAIQAQHDVKPNGPTYVEKAMSRALHAGDTTTTI